VSDQMLVCWFGARPDVSVLVWCQTSTLTTATRDCICSDKNVLLAQGIVTSHRLYGVTEQQLNNVIIYIYLIKLWNFDSLNFNTLRTGILSSIFITNH
jgi:hypothetical protein